MNLDLEVGGFLSRSFPRTPRTAGHLEYRSQDGVVTSAGILQELVENSGDAWDLALSEAGLFFERILSSALLNSEPPPTLVGTIPDPEDEAPAEVRDLLGSFFELAELLGTRTGEMHAALAGPETNEDFAPQSFTQLYQRALYQSIRSDIRRTCQSLRRVSKSLEGDLKHHVDTVIDQEATMLEGISRLTAERIPGKRIRIHGDYHLGQVLFTARDFVIIDFEGEPARPITERRIKRSPLRDVAGMVRSFHYAALSHIVRPESGAFLRAEDTARLEGWADAWYRWNVFAFLKGYFQAVQPAGLLPEKPEHLRLLLECFLVQKAMYEITYELNSRPDWLAVPVMATTELASTLIRDDE